MTPDTDIAALRHAVENGAHDTVKEAILTALNAAGSDGLTIDEMEQVLGGSHQVVSAAVTNLHMSAYPATGKIVALTATRLTRTKRPAHVYIHADQALSFAGASILAPTPPAWFRNAAYAETLVEQARVLDLRLGMYGENDDELRGGIKALKAAYDEYVKQFKIEPSTRGGNG